MKKRGLVIVVLVILGVILGVIVVDFLNNRPDRRGRNPYALEVDQYRKVDPSLVRYRETRNFDLGLLIAADMTLYNNHLYVAGNSLLVKISLDGTPMDMIEILPGATSVEVDDQQVIIGFRNRMASYDHRGTLLHQWAVPGDSTWITNLALKADKIFVADAGNRRIIIYNRDGEQTGEFEGKSESESGHGFIVPSPNFDLAVNSFGELWVVNPGKHALENYTEDGRLRGFWDKAGFDIEGFLGCCNPARIAVMKDGSFITSEKGMVRIKIYDPSGKLISVVAPPELFEGGSGKAPEVCVDDQGVVYALDFDRDRVRVFEPIDN